MQALTQCFDGLWNHFRGFGERIINSSAAPKFRFTLPYPRFTLELGGACRPAIGPRPLKIQNVIHRSDSAFAKGWDGMVFFRGIQIVIIIKTE